MPVEIEKDTSRPWYGVLAPLGRMSADDRIFDSEMEFSWRDLPLPLKYMQKDLPGHDESVPVASIEGLQVWNGLILGWGYFSDTPMATEAYDLVEDNVLRGVSVDLDMAESAFEDENGDPIDPMEAFFQEMDGGDPVRVIQRISKSSMAAATICAIPAFAEAFIALGERPENWEDMKVPGRSNFDGAVDNPSEETFRDYTEEERKEMAEKGWALPDGSYPIADKEDLENAIQAIGRASDPEAAKRHIKKRARELGEEDLIPEEWSDTQEESEEEPVAASAFTMVDPPEALVASGDRVSAQWFKNPGLTEPTPMTITEEGQVYGHAATWDTCHIGNTNECVTAPHSLTDYAYFRTGEVMTDEGPVAVGNVTMSTGHADLSLAASSAKAHYDDTGTVVADITAGEDEHGIWVAGALRPDLTEKQVRELRASAISGDWRPMGAGLEMVAALAVNVPGFPIPRVAIAASGTRTTALVAAGMLRQWEGGDTKFDAKALVKATIQEVRADDARRERMAKVKASITKDNMKRRDAVLASLGKG